MLRVLPAWQRVEEEDQENTGTAKINLIFSLLLSFITLRILSCRKIMGGCPFTLPEKDKGENFDDCPLVVVPDDVPDRFQRVQKPHERGVGSPAEIKGRSVRPLLHMIKGTVCQMMYRLGTVCRMMYRMDYSGFRNHMNEESGRLRK